MVIIATVPNHATMIAQLAQKLAKPGPSHYPKRRESRRKSVLQRNVQNEIEILEDRATATHSPQSPHFLPIARNPVRNDRPGAEDAWLRV